MKEEKKSANFEQKSDKYSGDQLEEVAARKRIEYSERNTPKEEQ